MQKTGDKINELDAKQEELVAGMKTDCHNLVALLSSMTSYLKDHNPDKGTLNVYTAHI